MSLLRTKSIQVNAILAFTGVSAEEGLSFFYGPPSEFALECGDVVKVVDIDRSRQAETPWAKVTVAVLKGKFVGRMGVVGIDLSSRLQRSWQALTETGSMAPVRTTGRTPAFKDRSAPYSVVIGKANKGDAAPTKPVPQGESKHGKCA